MGNTNAMNGTNETPATDEINITDWVVVNSPGGRYIGKPVDLTKEQVLEAVSNGDCLKLYPVLDFLAPMRPVQVRGPDGQPAMAMTRDPIVVPIDFVVHDIPVYVKAASVYFGTDMKEADKTTYKGFVQGALRQALEARAHASGLTLAAGALPTNGKVSPLRG